MELAGRYRKIRKYVLYCITNFIWTISLYLSNATGYVVQQAYKLDFINNMADSIYRP